MYYSLVSCCHVLTSLTRSLGDAESYASFFFVSSFNCVCSYLAMTQYQRKCTEKMTQFTNSALMPRISFAGTTAKLWRLFLHPKSTLIREYPPRGKSQKPWVIQTCLYHPLSILRAKCGLRCLLPKWSRCPGYSNHTREHDQEADHNTFHRLLVFIVSAALSQAKPWGAQSSIRKTLAKIRNFTPFENVALFCIIL